MENWKRFLKEEEDPYGGYRARGDAEAGNLARGNDRVQEQSELEGVAQAMEAAVGDWIYEDYMEWPEVGLEDRETFLKQLNAFSVKNAGVSVADVL